MPSNGPLAVIVENLPRFLKEFLLWCVWRAKLGDRQGKFPVSPVNGGVIGVNRPREWTRFEEAVAAYQRGLGAGLGVLLRAEDNVVGIDLDDAIDEDGKIKLWATPIVAGIRSYWELSPSRRGLRSFIRGTLPPDCPKKMDVEGGRIEVYCEGRFLSVTGHRLLGAPEDVTDCPEQLQQFIAVLVRQRMVASLPPAASGPDAVAFPSPSYPPADIAGIVEGCAWIRHCRDDAARLSEPEWYGMLSVIGHCENGPQLAHQWSCSYPNYSPGETAAKLEQALDRSGPVTCQYVETGLGQGRFCQTCPNRGRVRSPIVLGQVVQVEIWPEPERLEQDLLPVAKFDLVLMPESLRPFVRDVTERLQVPADFIAAALLVTLGGITGRRARILPKQFDHGWSEVGNLWGAIVAEPGTMKTPAINTVLRSVHEMEVDAAQHFTDAMAQYEQEYQDWKQARASGGSEEPPEKPTCIRYLLNDATTQKMQAIMSENVAGVLLHRDELAGHFASLDSKGRETDRAFYLECWSGDQSYTVDRILRGTVRAMKICLSLFGGIQPGRLRPYLLGAILGGEGDDGLMQRLQILVYPDPLDTWEHVDREPDLRAEVVVSNVLRMIASGPADGFIARFDPEAQIFFNEWWKTLEHRLLREPMPSYIRSHLAKYRGLCPRIAMLCHLAEAGFVPEIPLHQIQRAAGWCQYLETHARRVYSEGSPRTIAALLGAKISSGALGTRFTLREVQKKGWSGFANPAIIRVVLRELEESGWIRKEQSHSTERGGRPSEAYRVNPRVYDGHQVGGA